MSPAPSRRSRRAFPGHRGRLNRKSDDDVEGHPGVTKPVWTLVPMHCHDIEHLDHLNTSGTTGFLRPKLATKGPGGEHGLSESFKRIARKAGIGLGVAEGKGTGKSTQRKFHPRRHSFHSISSKSGDKSFRAPTIKTLPPRSGGHFGTRLSGEIRQNLSPGCR